MGSVPRVLVIIGTRPEGIKLAPVVEGLRLRRDEIDARVVLTGQHTTLIDQVLDIFRLDVSRDLGIMKEGQSLYDVAHGCLDGLSEVVRELRPEMLLVQGDTASVFFGALVGFFERVRVGHVEAGLRSRDKWQPYPEEMLRRMTGVVADVHFAPTREARDNLVIENISPDTIHVTGNTVVDAVRRMADVPHDVRDPALRGALGSGRRLVLVTAHRRESFGEPLRDAFRALRDIAEAHDDIEILYPVHPNPNVRTPAQEILAGHGRIRLTEPLDYLDLIRALRSAVLAITDSGGIQEEAPTFGTPVLVMREVTERPEGVAAGVAQLVGTDRERIVAAATQVLAQSARTRLENPYGDGRAGERIADIVIHELTGVDRRTQDWTP